MKLKECENIWCKYNDNLKCELDDICINSYGMCDECIMMKPPETAKEKGLVQKRENDIM